MTVCAARQLVPTSELLHAALKGKYAVGAYNVNNMELLQAIVEAGNELRAPLILQVSAGARKYANQAYLIKLVEAALNSSDIPISLHLDHGEDFEICKACIDGGFSSVMIDGSKHPFEENVALVKQVVEYAHQRGVSVEAELGRLAGVEDNISVTEKDAIYTNPKEAAEFVERTGVDSLAVAIGTSHGAYKFKGEAKLDFERLAEIQKAVGFDYPLVLHGASSVPEELVKVCNDFGAEIPGAKGVPEEMFSQATKLGVAKINVDTDLRLAFTGAIRKHFAENPSHFDPRQYLTPARAAVKEIVKHKIQVFGTNGRV
ncbi:MAG: fructose-1,6-bisphosphate aldolase, class II [Candidatus Melainabacteria bacterium RIFOXYA12_FULL_32_12]|nr:MAG: fructose-1,6-bisphosphate aldolase, class II [Candidatus Melainabacteria bacterium RIFOXYA2_FULL_32_9]OGI30185.1 MAG: fructose-1,6-bisphosphate aldolase, class II [Candidatus Melainabacteria bacterium RIFOXYA12_FULL_32_12]